MMTALNELDIAVSCMKMGAFDYLVKPVELSRFETSIKRALEMRALKSEVSSLKKLCSTAGSKTRRRFPPSLPLARRCAPYSNT